MAGLLWPKLHWTNETAVVKQSLFSAVAIFGGWAAGLLLSVGGFLLAAVLPVAAALLFCAAVLALADTLLLNWVKGKGCRRFETL